MTVRVLSVAILMICCLTGCDVTFRDSPAKGFEIPADPQLAGPWTSKETSSKKSVELVITTKHNHLSARYTNPELDDDGRPIVILIEGETFQVGDNTFVSASADEERKRQEGGAPAIAFVLGRFKVDQDVLTVWLMDLKSTWKAVRSGKLAGRASYSGPDGPIEITSSPAEVAKFLDSAGFEDVFGKEGVFIRKKAATNRESKKPASRR